MPNILYPVESYADTLLALGISAAFNVEPRYNGSNYLFPETGDEPISFPVSAGEDYPDPPFTYHRFKDSALKALAGANMVAMLAEQWQQFEPTYVEVMEVIRLGYDFKKSRFWKAPTLMTGSATFRPAGSKGSIAEPTLKEFWLLDALRAIGFLTFAAPKLLRAESSVCRWIVFVPVIPHYDFSGAMLHQPDLEIGSRTELAAHLIASQLGIPRLYVTQYAELNPLARTPIRIYALESRHFTVQFTEKMFKVAYALGRYPKAEQQKLCRWLLDAIEQVDMLKIGDFVSKYNIDITLRNYAMPIFETSMVDEIITSERLIDAYLQQTG